VQKKELDYSKNPHPLDADFYVPRYWEKIKFDVINGDAKIEPGLSVFLSPGHSPGGQSEKSRLLPAQPLFLVFAVLAILLNKLRP
jgi:hypothetical protein